MRAPSRIVLLAVGALVLAATACDQRIEVGPGNSRASGVSGSGWIVGSYTEPATPGTRSFIVEPDDGPTHLVGLPPGRCGGGTTLTDVNAAGLAVGNHFTSDCTRGITVPVRWTKDRGLEQLPTAAGSANAVNDAGQIAGLALGAGPQPVVFEPDGRIRPLAPAPGGAFVTPVAINQSGDVLGAGPAGPLVWDAAGGAPVALPTTGLNGDVIAADLDDRGRVVGQARVGGRLRAVVWDAGAAPYVLMGGDGDSGANAVDSSGGVAGWITDQGVVRAIYWQPSLIQLDRLDPLEGSTAMAHDTSDAGFLVGEVRDADGSTTAARWDRPKPQG